MTIIASAPGRLDVMGGIADYSGSLVLQLPLDLRVTVTLEPRDDTRLHVTSHRAGGPESFAVDLGAPVPREPSWAPYVAGVVALSRAMANSRGNGMRLDITSTVPEGKGVASSAALEVACLLAVNQYWGVAMTREKVAEACQFVENNVVGAPCGIMDQMTAVCGEPGKLLRLRCQPATIEGHVPVPAGCRFYGIDSGIRHAVTGADYETVRTAAFIGRWVIGTQGSYLANITPAEYAERYAAMLPESMTGTEVIGRRAWVEDREDHAVRIRPEAIYPVRAATAHPIHENARVERFADMLHTDRVGAGPVPARMEEMGALMYQSHASYTACGLGSDGTDQLVEMVKQAGPAKGLFGAKITGGGSGGTVAILGTVKAEHEVRRIAEDYAAATGRGSSVIV